MKTCWIIGGTIEEISSHFLYKTLQQYDYNVFFIHEKGESFSRNIWGDLSNPDFIFFHGKETTLSFTLSQLSMRFGKTYFPPIIAFSPISPSLILKMEEINIYPLVFLYEGEKVTGMILGVGQHPNDLRELREIFRQSSLSFMVMDRLEAFILHGIYQHWKKSGTNGLKKLNAYCKKYLCDGMNILRGIGLDSGIGQKHLLPPLIQKGEIPFLLSCIQRIGCRNITVWGEPGNSEEVSFYTLLKGMATVQSCFSPPLWDSVKGTDLLILFGKMDNLKEIRIIDWERNRNLFHCPHIMDTLSLYEPGEMEAIGYRYFSLFRYKSFINGEE